jgi:hypothetical protein
MGVSMKRLDLKRPDLKIPMQTNRLFNIFRRVSLARMGFLLCDMKVKHMITYSSAHFLI